jgi:hypothetical protein
LQGRTYTPALPVLCALPGAFAPIGAKWRLAPPENQTQDGRLSVIGLPFLFLKK